MYCKEREYLWTKCESQSNSQTVVFREGSILRIAGGVPFAVVEPKVVRAFAELEGDIILGQETCREHYERLRAGALQVGQGAIAGEKANSW